MMKHRRAVSGTTEGKRRARAVSRDHTSVAQNQLMTGDTFGMHFHPGRYGRTCESLASAGIISWIRSLGVVRSRCLEKRKTQTQGAGARIGTSHSLCSAKDIHNTVACHERDWPKGEQWFR
jgi:hypothetical protein